jgi:hypothetical protein
MRISLWWYPTDDGTLRHVVLNRYVEDPGEGDIRRGNLDHQRARGGAGRPWAQPKVMTTTASKPARRRRVMAACEEAWL